MTTRAKSGSPSSGPHIVLVGCRLGSSVLSPSTIPTGESMVKCAENERIVDSLNVMEPVSWNVPAYGALATPATSHVIEEVPVGVPAQVTVPDDWVGVESSVWPVRVRTVAAPAAAGR